MPERPNLQVRVLRGRDPGSGPQPTQPPSAEARLALVDELTRACWALAGRPMPAYARAAMPVRAIRRTPRQSDR